MAIVLRDKTRAIQFIGAASSLGTTIPGCARAPAAMRAGGIERRIAGGAASWSATWASGRAFSEAWRWAMARSLARAAGSGVGDHALASAEVRDAAKAMDVPLLLLAAGPLRARTLRRQTGMPARQGIRSNRHATRRDHLNI